ncbi:MAG: hypothetical protein V3G42_14875 [Oscillospiraceae bacterium]
MKKVGRPLKPFTEKELQAVKEYLTGEDSYKEVAEKYGFTLSSMQYKVEKYRKQMASQSAGGTDEA